MTQDKQATFFAANIGFELENDEHELIAGTMQSDGRLLLSINNMFDGSMFIVKEQLGYLIDNLKALHDRM